MNAYRDVYRMYGLPQLAVDLAMGNVRVPWLAVSQPAENYGFPPALVPLWSEMGGGEIYYAYWHHWFSKRRPTVVRCYVGWGQVREVARTVEQLVRIMCMKYLVMFGEVDDEIRRFAAEAGFTDEVPRIAEMVKKHGDDYSAFLAHPLFRDDPPLLCFPDGVGYAGDFPHENVPRPIGALRSVCSFEVYGWPKEVTASRDAPIWLHTSDQPSVFEAALAAGDFAAAWMSLNSGGWTFRRAREALRSLARAAGDEGLTVLAEAWCGLPHEEWWGKGV